MTDQDRELEAALNLIDSSLCKACLSGPAQSVTENLVHSEYLDAGKAIARKYRALQAKLSAPEPGDCNDPNCPDPELHKLLAKTKTIDPDAPEPGNEIWLVEGSTGEYSDHREWPVCFFYNEADAKAKVEFLSAMSREAKKIAGTDCDYEKEREAEEFMLSHDPAYQTDYTGTNYAAYPVSLGRTNG